MSFEGFVFLISGAASDLGETLCEMLLKYNATVIGLYHKKKIKNPKVDSFKCDITNEKDIKKLESYIKNKYHHLDVLVHFAALCEDVYFMDKDAKSFSRVINTNILGTFLLDKCAINLMESGVIINMSSLDATKTYNKYNLDYAASKAAVENITKNLAKNTEGIKICALAPGWINTANVLAADPKYLEEELKRNEQEELIAKEDVALKIIEMIINNDNYISGDIVIMEKGEYHG